MSHLPKAASFIRVILLMAQRDWQNEKSSKTTIKTILAAYHPKQLWLPYRNAREKMAVKEPLDKEGLDLAKPLVSKIWNKKKKQQQSTKTPCSTQKKIMITPERHFVYFQSREIEHHQSNLKTSYYKKTRGTRRASG